MHPDMRPALLLLVLLAAPAMAADTWPYETECRKWVDVAIPKQDIGNAAASCDTQSLYYGSDGKGDGRDFAAARHCAYRERAAGGDLLGQGTMFGGSGALMMLYANGQGVKRNLPLAKRFACEYGGAPAEVQGRLNHIDDLAKGEGDGPFDLCDDVTSGMMMGFCARRDADFARAVRGKRWSLLQNAWTPAQRDALAALRAAAKGYFDNVSREETDMSGSARGMFATEAYETLDVALLDDLERFDKRPRPPQTAADFPAADKALNAAYKRTLAALDAGQHPEGFGDYGTITSTGVRATQRSWLRYRDAWVRFGTTRWPQTPADAWKAWLTAQRTNALKALTAEP